MDGDEQIFSLLGYSLENERNTQESSLTSELKNRTSKEERSKEVEKKIFPTLSSSLTLFGATHEKKNITIQSVKKPFILINTLFFLFFISKRIFVSLPPFYPLFNDS